MTRRTTTTATLAAGALVAAGLAASTSSASASTSGSAAAPNVPSSCTVNWNAYNSTGALYWYRYQRGNPSSTRVSSNSLGWRPTAYQQVGASGDTGSFKSTQIATTPGGQLKTIEQSGTLKGGKWSVRQSTGTIATSGWKGTRALAYGYPYLYRLHGSTVTRYTVSGWAGTSLKVSSPKLVGTTYADTRSIVYERSGTTSVGKLDVILANGKSGKLIELRVPQKTPTKRATKTLRSTGYQNFRSLTTTPCGSKGRAIGGLTDKNRMYVYYDVNATNQSGTDIRGGWTGRGTFGLQAFGQ